MRVRFSKIKFVYALTNPVYRVIMINSALIFAWVEARRWREEAKKQNKLLNIGVVNRYNEAVEKLAEMNANGEFGKIYHVYCSFRRHRGIPGLGGDNILETMKLLETLYKSAEDRREITFKKQFFGGIK